MLQHESIGNLLDMGNVEGTCEILSIEEMGSYKIEMFIGVPLGGRRSYRVRSSEE